MTLAKKGSKVLINFTGTLEDGSVFDSTREHDDCSTEDGCTEDGCGCSDDGADDCGCEVGPLELTIGAEEFFPQVEAALIGMAPGEKKTVLIPAADAFGEYDEEQVFSIGPDQMPADITPEVGLELEFTDEDGEAFMVTVVEITEEGITLDANHPLAGENISYEIELMEILP